MIDAVLFGLPVWAVAVLVIVSCICAVVLAAVVIAGQSDDRLVRARERRVERVEQRMIALNHRDVQDRRERIEAWDTIGAEADRVWPENVVVMPEREPAPVIPIPTDLMEHDGLGAA